MDLGAGTTSASAYRNRKRPLDGRPCNPKVKRRLFPVDVAPGRAAEVDRLVQKRLRRWKVMYKANYMIQAAAKELRRLVEMGSYSRGELHPFHESIDVLLSAMRDCDEAADVRPDLYDDDDNDSTISSSPPSLVVESGGSGAAFVAVTNGDDYTVRSKRRATADSRLTLAEADSV